MTEDGKGVRYDELRQSALFSQYEDQAELIRNVDLSALSEDEKYAFFISILWAIL
jgi:hypothetical protein